MSAGKPTPIHDPAFSHTDDATLSIRPMYVGTAGWGLPPATRHEFGEGATLLTRYATRFSCVEINSSFYRSHRRATYERWASAVPDHFRFSVKMPREVTHKRRLADVIPLLDAFCDETSGLGPKLTVVLVQLPPSFVFDAAVAAEFFTLLRSRSAAAIACEPRHASWFGDEAQTLLRECSVTRVAADPAAVPAAAVPGGSDRLTYVRLHGSPLMYASSYDEAALASTAAVMRASRPAWCIFDNTQFGAATTDALRLIANLASG